MKALKLVAVATCGLAGLWASAQLYSYWSVSAVNEDPIRSFSGMMTQSTWEAKMVRPLGYKTIYVVRPAGLVIRDDGSTAFQPYIRVEKKYLFFTRTEKHPIE